MDKLRKLEAFGVFVALIVLVCICVAAIANNHNTQDEEVQAAEEAITEQCDVSGAGETDDQDVAPDSSTTTEPSTQPANSEESGIPADTSPPLISGIAVIDITSISANITWNSDEPATSLIDYGLTSGYGSASPDDANTVASHSVILSGLTSGTTYHFRVKSKDASGNEAISDDGVFTTSDATPPVISNIVATDITVNSARITWNTDEPATSLVEYGLTSGYGSISPDDANMVASHSVVLSGLTSGTTYHFRVKSKDVSGNEAISDDSVLTTSDVTAPAISKVAATNITQNSASVTWSTDEPATSQVEYGLTSDYGSTSPADANMVASHSVVLTGLTSGTTYHFRVKSKDAYGNEAISGDSSFATAQTSSDGFNRALLTLTFDDGWQDTYTYALPALNSHGFKSTQYIISGEIDSYPYVGESEIQAYAASGHEIASHTVSHLHLPEVSASVLDYELSASKERLQSIPGVGAVTNFATPYGEYNSTVITAVRGYYGSHRTVDEGYNTKANFDIYGIRVQNMTNTTTLSEVQSWIENAKVGNYWLVLVYHKIGPDPDTWDTSADDFYDQLDMIASEGIAVLTLQDTLAEILPQLT